LGVQGRVGSEWRAANSERHPSGRKRQKIKNKFEEDRRPTEFLDQSLRSESKGFHFSVLSTRIDLLSIKLELDAPSVSGFDGNLLATLHFALATGR
jgi:hypothetical protein